MPYRPAAVRVSKWASPSTARSGQVLQHSTTSPCGQLDWFGNGESGGNEGSWSEDGL